MPGTMVDQGRLASLSEGELRLDMAELKVFPCAACDLDIVLQEGHSVW
jgi:hypothetical protein